MSSSEPPAALVVSQTELARIFRVTTRTIQRWHEDGLPRIDGPSGPKYDLADVVAWAIDRERAKAEPADEDYDRALARKTAAQAELAEIQVARERGQLVAMDDVEAMVAGPLEQVDTTLRNAPARHASALAAKGKIKTAAAQRILGNIIEGIRADLHALFDAEDADAAA